MVFGIHIEDADSGPANGRLANQIEAAPFEVFVPALEPRMEYYE